MNHKKTRSVLELEALLEGLEMDVPVADLGPLLGGLHSRSDERTRVLDPTSLERRLQMHIEAVHSERLNAAMKGGCFALLYDSKALRPSVYTEAEGGVDPPSKETLAHRLRDLRDGQATLDRHELETLGQFETVMRAERAEALSLGGLARLGREVSGDPTFIVYEALGSLEADDAATAERLLRPLSEVPDFVGLHPSTFAGLAAASVLREDYVQAAQHYRRGTPESQWSLFLGLHWFFCALVGGDPVEAQDADAALLGLAEAGSHEEVLVQTFIRRAQAAFMPRANFQSPLPSRLSMRGEDGYRSEVARRICHAFIEK